LSDQQALAVHQFPRRGDDLRQCFYDLLVFTIHDGHAGAVSFPQIEQFTHLSYPPEQTCTDTDQLEPIGFRHTANRPLDLRQAEPAGEDRLQQVRVTWAAWRASAAFAACPDGSASA